MANATLALSAIQRGLFSPHSEAQAWFDRAIGVQMGREDDGDVKPRVTLGHYCCFKSSRTWCPDHGELRQNVVDLLKAHGLSDRGNLILSVFPFTDDSADVLRQTPL